MDFNGFIIEVPDPFSEIPPHDLFMNQFNETWAQRTNLPAIHQEIDQQEFSDPTYELELEYVIGRRAIDRRNNVKIDNANRIVFNVASLIVFMEDNHDPDSNSYVKQSFLRPQKDRFATTSPEVSCFSLSEDRRFLFVGGSGVEASLMVWEISTNIQVASIKFSQFSLFYHIAVAFDNRHLVLLGVTSEYIPTILLYDYYNETILC